MKGSKVIIFFRFSLLFKNFVIYVNSTLQLKMKGSMIIKKALISAYFLLCFSFLSYKNATYEIMSLCLWSKYYQTSYKIYFSKQKYKCVSIFQKAFSRHIKTLDTFYGSNFTKLKE